MNRPPELLAPAGNSDNFFAAFEAGADAVYVGLPGFNARNLSKELRLEEVAAMIAYCRDHGKKIYIAANSLILQQELPKVIELLTLLEQLAPDALIVQDIGLVHLLRTYFPKLKFHASTLMAAHSVPSVQAMANLGCQRIVLARELSLAEIDSICKSVDVEIEVFIHGAMCFSYSGLCLFSSYFGGKSGLRGRCVQPCRRSYKVGGQQGKATGKSKGGYLFSMNDLSGLDAVASLREMGVASLKIEGRLRSANYVRAVVQAYRKVLDAPEGHNETALVEARELLQEARSRKVSSGYFFSVQPADAISPFHSGNLGQYLGRIEKRPAASSGGFFTLTIREAVHAGDRLRLHLEPTGDRFALNLKDMKVDGALADTAEKGTAVALPLPADIPLNWKHIDVYKVDEAEESHYKREAHSLGAKKYRDRIASLLQASQKIIGSINGRVGLYRIESLASPDQASPEKPEVLRHANRLRKAPESPSIPLEWWVKLSSPALLSERWPVFPEKIILPMTTKNVGQAGQLKRQLGSAAKKVLWTLPAIIFDRERSKYLKLVASLMKNGYRGFQVQHLSHVLLFLGEKVNVTADYTLNICNAEAIRLAKEVGISALQLSIESDRKTLQTVIQQYRRPSLPSGKPMHVTTPLLGLTVYGWPALYTARLASSFFQYDTPIFSPKDEGFTLEKGDGCIYTVPQQPFSLLPYLHELKRMHLDYAVIDMTHCHNEKKELQKMFERLQNPAAKGQKLSTFNYCGQLS